MTSCTSLAYCPDHDLLLLHGAWALSKYPNTIAPRYIFGRFVEINGGIEVSDMSVSLDDFSERVITPAMPPRLARACCISNFVIPGSGSFFFFYKSYMYVPRCEVYHHVELYKLKHVN